ncbi:MAG TPA: cell division protein ZapA [Firmicutes bacterium]|nr:cell division protein ZapA [Bacillota bacterium]
MSPKRETTSVRVQIFGEEHIVRGQASAEYIKELAAAVDARLQEVQGNNPVLARHKTAILVALNIANELEKLKKEHEELLALVKEAN